MRVGLLARCDNRGIGYQTHEFFKHMKPHRTLVLCLNDAAWPEDMSRYNFPNVDYVSVGPDRVIEDRKILKLLRDIDVLFAVETMMDWRIAEWAREAGVRTVVQGNPEFYVHDRFGFPHPDRWVWPTNWMLDALPGDWILPVPTPDECPVRAGDYDDERLRVLHVAGHAAAGDRNGTINFMESLQYVGQPIEVTVVGQDHWLPEPPFVPKHVTLHRLPTGVEDRWSMYAGQHVVMLPRKYGGLCLPAQEACRAGCAVVMPDCVPNETWPGPRLMTRKGRNHRTPYGSVGTFDVEPRRIARAIDEYAKDRQKLENDMIDALLWGATNTWMMLQDQYEEALS